MCSWNEDHCRFLWLESKQIIERLLRHQSRTNINMLDYRVEQSSNIELLRRLKAGRDGNGSLRVLLGIPLRVCCTLWRLHIRSHKFATPLGTEWNETVTDLAHLVAETKEWIFLHSFLFILFLRAGKYILAGSTDSLQLKLAINKGVFLHPSVCLPCRMTESTRPIKRLALLSLNCDVRNLSSNGRVVCFSARLYLTVYCY